ncbi:MAG: hypothetical protein GQ477_04655 [Nanohaloarchaea archaeon]|nr:hypothetical protein [Candidatus Nanohaloarchaea archaeon]
MFEDEYRPFDFMHACTHIILVIFILISAAMVPVFAEDTTAPITTDNYTSTWTNYDWTILLTATDDDSGVNTTRYCVGADTCTPDQTGTIIDITCNPDTVCYQLYVRYHSTDNAGNNETVKTSDPINIDKIKPATYDNYVSKDGIWQNENQTIFLTAAETGSGKLYTKYCIDTVPCIPSSTYRGPLFITDEGITYLGYATTDKAGNVQDTVTVTIKIDKASPTVDAGTDKTTNAQILQTATTSDNLSGIASHNWTKTSGPGIITFDTPTEETTTISADTDGTYIIRLTATDNVGNTGYDEMTLIWDTTLPDAPDITITDPITPENEMAVTITGTGEPNATINYTITDSTLDITGTSTVDISGNINITDIDVSTLSDGTLIVSAILTDLIGNSGAITTGTATKDTVAPTAPDITATDPITPSNEMAVTITGTGEPNATINYTITDGSLNITGNATVDSSGTINITGIDVSDLSDGTLTVSMILTDSFGNTGLAGTDNTTKDTYVAPIEPIKSYPSGGSHTILPYCGDNICQSTELQYDPRTDEGCEADCGVLEYCGDNICQTGEDYNLCPSDCENDETEITETDPITEPIIEPIIPIETDTSITDTVTAADTDTESQIAPLTGFVTANLETLKDSKTSISLVLLIIFGLLIINVCKQKKS